MLRLNKQPLAYKSPAAHSVHCQEAHTPCTAAALHLPVPSGLVSFASNQMPVHLGVAVVAELGSEARSRWAAGEEAHLNQTNLGGARSDYTPSIVVVAAAEGGRRWLGG